MALIVIELRNQRASRIRENQRRCRERKTLYIRSLEERIRKYERKCMEADLELQRRTQILKLENAKLKKIVLNSTGINNALLEKDSKTLVHEIKRKLELQAETTVMISNGQGYCPLQLTAKLPTYRQPRKRIPQVICFGSQQRQHIYRGICRSALAGIVVVPSRGTAVFRNSAVQNNLRPVKTPDG